jgi:hypothetical protein
MIPKVVTHTLSTIAYSYNRHAKLYPVYEALINFASHIPRNIFDYNSRLAKTPSRTTVHRNLRLLAMKEGEELKEIGQDEDKALILVIDNVQTYKKVRDMRIGRENSMMVGIAGTAILAVDFHKGLLDPEHRLRQIRDGRRQRLTVDQLLGYLDPVHHEIVGALQWLRNLVTYVPQLTRYKSDVSRLYAGKGAKMKLATRKSVLYPLATSNKNEAITLELKDGLLDFFEQIGQTRDSYLPRSIIVSGDGMTMTKLLQVKRYMQFHHKNQFDSFRLLEAAMQPWHGSWTDNSRIHETHWGDEWPDDPSTLGYAAAQMGLRRPPNLKKVDYYPGVHLTYLNLDGRMLDCWRCVLVRYLDRKP